MEMMLVMKKMMRRKKMKRMGPTMSKMLRRRPRMKKSKRGRGLRPLTSRSRMAARNDYTQTDRGLASAAMTPKAMKTKH